MLSKKKLELESMSLDDLWSLHEKISAILAARIKAEKHELEKRLAVLDRGVGAIDQPGEAQLSDAKRRRKYPRVLPKYRNPKTSETWSGTHNWVISSRPIRAMATAETVQRRCE
jgi:DNA-binding protein H-NS